MNLRVKWKQSETNGSGYCASERRNWESRDIPREKPWIWKSQVSLGFSDGDGRQWERVAVPGRLRGDSSQHQGGSEALKTLLALHFPFLFFCPFLRC